MNPDTEKISGRKHRSRVLRWLPLLLLLLAIAGFFALGLGRYLTLGALAEHRDWLLGEVARFGPIAALGFILIYAAVVALSVPGGAVMTVAGGFLFGAWLGGLYALVAATLGATILFLVARTSLGEALERRAGPFLRSLDAGFREHAASYLLVLRLVPLFPFWLVNLVPAFLGVPLRTFVLASVIGMAPGTFVYASLGNGLGAIVAAGKSPDLGIIFQWRVLGPLLALAFLALLPVAYKRLKRGGILP